MKASLFTKIINREIPAKIIYETETVLAFEDINPQAPHHYLIVTKKEIPTINDLSAETAPLIGDLFLAAKEIAKQKGGDELQCRSGTIRLSHPSAFSCRTSDALAAGVIHKIIC
jgi:hypothetical protein